MKNKIIISLFFLSFFLFISEKIMSQEVGGEYVYIQMHHKFLSAKNKVHFDFGDTKEQLQKAELYSEKFDGTKSYMSVLNSMSQEGYELVETLDYTVTSDGNGGTAGLIFIMRKKSGN